MTKKKIALITGSCGLIGSESVRFFIEKGFTVVGIDNDMRGFFFGKDGSTQWLKTQLVHDYPDKYIHLSIDIRQEVLIEKVFKKYPFDLIIHTAAQPSHDWAATEPLADFSINANATVILLDKFRRYCPKAVFIFTSSSKVYGDRLNILPFIEYKKRFDLPKKHHYYDGIDESMSIDESTHSLYGASKTAADIMVQEYGRYYHLHTGVFRGNCMTGSAHSGTSQHGFLSYLAKCIRDKKPYTIFGYKGKQVRDNIHAYDFVNAFYKYYQDPRHGEVYNLGGGRNANVSILEAIEKIETITKKKAIYNKTLRPRKGDHIWYISNNKKFLTHYPQWGLTYSIDMILREIILHANKVEPETTS